MCRVCLKRPEIPDERHGRCETCARGGRVAYRFRLGPGRGGAPLSVRAGELSPRALRQRFRAPLLAFTRTPSPKSHLGLHEMELVVARDRIESVRIAPDLEAQAEAAMAGLRQAAERTEAGW